jgi:hypothetical protein
LERRVVFQAELARLIEKDENPLRLQRNAYKSCLIPSVEGSIDPKRNYEKQRQIGRCFTVLPESIEQDQNEDSLESIRKRLGGIVWIR